MATVLIIEDDVVTRDVICQVLQLEGHNAVTASNGIEAFDYLNNNPQPNLIILDIMMPEMDGIEFRRWQLKREDLAKIPVLVMSAAYDIGQIVSQLGADGFLRKPLRFQELSRQIGAFCSHPV